MTADLARDRRPSAIRPIDEGWPSFAEYQPLNRHTGDPTPLPSTPDWLATISAGKRADTGPGQKPGLPMMSRDGRIELHDPDGRAPGLAEALKATDHKRLLIAFVSNNPADVIQERIVGYTATTLKYHGDSESITELTPVRKVHLKGTPGYAAALAASTVSRRVFFALARWDDDGTPRVYFPDGLGLYSIRTTSARSTANIAATLALIGRQTGGIIVGLPFELSLSARQVADPAGQLRTVSLWSMVFSPPKTMQLTSGTFRMLAEKSLEQGRALMLPGAPRPESIEDAAYEGSFTVEDAPTVCNPSDADLAIMQRGTPVSRQPSLSRWFAIARGSRFYSNEGRAEFLSAWSDGNTSSLAELLDTSTQEEIDGMLATLECCVDDGERQPEAWEGLGVAAPPEPDPEPVPAKVSPMRRQRLVERYTELFEDALKAGLESDVLGLDLDWTDEQLANNGREIKAILERHRAGQLEDIERERIASAAANRAAIDAARNKIVDRAMQEEPEA